MSSGNKVSSLNGLIPFKTVYEKRGELLWPFVSLKNLISLRSVAFVTIFVCNSVQACKFHVNLETAGFILFFFSQTEQFLDQSFCSQFTCERPHSFKLN